MAIGLEIEVNIPIDKLAPADVTYVENDVQNPAVGSGPQVAQRMRVKGYIQHQGKVIYGTMQAAANGFRLDADHDDRVKTIDPITTSGVWPPREGGEDSIVEI